MRILLSSYGSRGDIEPLAAFGKAAQSLGAEVVISAPQDEEYVALITRAGLELAPAAMAMRQWIDEAKAARMPLPLLAAKLIALQYKAIDAAASGCDLIVATALFPSLAAAQCVAEKRGIPYRHVSLCPLFLPSHHHGPPPYPGQSPTADADNRALWAANAQLMNALFGEAINAYRASIGLRAVENVRDLLFTKSPVLASDPILWPWFETDLCQAVQTGAWILPDTRPLPDALQAFLDAGAPPIYVGFGSIQVQQAKEIAEAAIKAVRVQGRRIVLARGHAEMTLIDGKDDCMLIGEVNQQALFPHCAVVVHHGGAGTTTTAARAGVPQVIVPQIVDQPYWAARVEALGVGVAHDGPTPTVASLSAALERALAPRLRAHARDVSRNMSADGALAAAKLLIAAA